MGEVRWDAKGPFILWSNYGYDGWSPNSFDTLKEAIEGDRYCSEFVITRIVDWQPSETPPEPKQPDEKEVMPPGTIHSTNVAQPGPSEPERPHNRFEGGPSEPVGRADIVDEMAAEISPWRYDSETDEFVHKNGGRQRAKSFDELRRGRADIWLLPPTIHIWREAVEACAKVAEGTNPKEWRTASEIAYAIRALTPSPEGET